MLYQQETKSQLSKLGGSYVEKPRSKSTERLSRQPEPAIPQGGEPLMSERRTSRQEDSKANQKLSISFNDQYKSLKGLANRPKLRTAPLPLIQAVRSRSIEVN